MSASATSRSTPSTARTSPENVRSSPLASIADIARRIEPRLRALALARQGRGGVDPPASVRSLERLRGVQQQLVAAPRGKQLQPDRQPLRGQADRDADRGDPGQVGDSGLARIRRSRPGRRPKGARRWGSPATARAPRPSARRARRPARTAPRASAAPGCAPATPWRSPRPGAGAGSAGAPGRSGSRRRRAPRPARGSRRRAPRSEPTRIEAIRTCSRPAEVDLGRRCRRWPREAPPTPRARPRSPRRRSRPRAPPGRCRSAVRPARRPPAPRRRGRRPRGRQSAASRHSGPETIVVVSATWWPPMADRPKVGFRPVSPQ